MGKQAQRLKMMRHDAWNRQEGRCSRCHKPVEYHEATWDHTKPRAAGGRTSRANGTMMCRRCNSKKGCAYP